MGLAQGFEFRLRFQVFQSGLIAIVQGIGLLNQIVDADELFSRLFRLEQQPEKQQQTRDKPEPFHILILPNKSNRCKVTSLHIVTSLQRADPVSEFRICLSLRERTERGL